MAFRVPTVPPVCFLLSVAFRVPTVPPVCFLEFLLSLPMWLLEFLKFPNHTRVAFRVPTVPPSYHGGLDYMLRTCLQPLKHDSLKLRENKIYGF